MADRREISMNHVANPTSYEPRDSNLPPGTRAGVTVHYSATTISDKWAHLLALLLPDLSPTRKEVGRWRRPLRGGHRTYALRDKAPVHFH